MSRPALCLVLLAGCAHTPVESAAPSWKLLSATPDITEIQFQTTDTLNRATVTDSGARGPFVDLKRAAGRIQGTIRVDLPVDLQAKGNQITGRYAGDNYDLTLMPDGDETRATGLVRGQPSTVWLSPQKIRGTVGECRFDLVWRCGHRAADLRAHGQRDREPAHPRGARELERSRGGRAADPGGTAAVSAVPTPVESAQSGLTREK